MLVCCTWDYFLSRDRKHWTWPATSHHGPRVQGSRWPSCPNDLEKRQKGGDGRHWKRGDVPMFVAILIGKMMIWSTMKFRATLFSDKPLRHWRPSDVCRIGFNQHFDLTMGNMDSTRQQTWGPSQQKLGKIWPTWIVGVPPSFFQANHKLFVWHLIFESIPMWGFTDWLDAQLMFHFLDAQKTKPPHR